MGGGEVDGRHGAFGQQTDEAATMIRMTRSNTVLEFSAYESVRQRLLNHRDRERLDLPLACWVQPGDRSLPMVFMGRTVQQMLDTPFDQILATRGVGHKKICLLVELLQRVAESEGEAPPRPLGQPASGGSAAAVAQSGRSRRRPDQMSDELWARWQSTVVLHKLEAEKLGRFAVSLMDLPRVSWHTLLGTYTDLTLDELYGLKAHGEKRVAAVLEIFGSLYRTLSLRGPQHHLAVSVLPRFAAEIDTWATLLIQRLEVPTAADVAIHLVRPLVEQIRIDAGDEMARLAEDRLELHGPWEGARQRAVRMGVTRARVYHRFSDVAEIVSVRWPEGAPRIAELRLMFQAAGADQPDLTLFERAAALFFPSSGSPADAPPAPLAGASAND